MQVRWWYGVAAATLIWALGFLVLGVPSDPSPAVERASDPVAVASLVVWLAMPACIYLDQRGSGDDLAWDPSTGAWMLASLIWFLNVVVGTAYCFRRIVAARRTAPSRHWEAVIVASIVVWAISFPLDHGLPDGTLPEPLYDAMAVLVALAWVAMPVAVLVDAVRVRGWTDWDPNSRWFTVGAAVPVANLVVGPLYLYRRRLAFRETDRTEFSPPADEAGTREDERPGSPWFRRAGYVFGCHFLLVGAVALAVPSLSELALELFAIVAWLPFGPFFAVCVYRDVDWRRERGFDVGDSWWLYLLSVLVQGAAFWYLLRRASKSRRDRSRRVEATSGD